MGITAKLWLAFGSFFACFLLSVVLSVVLAQRSASSLTHVSAEVMPQNNLAKDCLLTFEMMRMNFEISGLQEDEATFEVAQQQAESFTTQLEDLAAQAAKHGDSSMTETFQFWREKHTAVAESYRLIAVEGEYSDEVLQALSTAREEFFPHIEKGLKVFANDSRAAAQEAIAESLKNSSHLNRLNAIIFCVFVFIGVGVFFVIRGIGRTMQTTWHAVDENQSTLNAIANEMAEASRASVSDAEVVSERADSMQGKSDETSQLATQINDHLVSAKSSAALLTQTMQRIEGVTTEIASSIQAASREAGNGATAAGMGSGLANAALRVMEDLGSSVASIDQVTGLIKDISKKTNLLALNATIEAASAGEAGAGFAVVAEEIKGLAGQSSEAADQIAELIFSVQEQSNRAASSINELVDSMHQVDRSAKSIAEDITSQSDAVSGIAEHVSSSTTQFNDIEIALDSLRSNAEALDVAAKESFVSGQDIVASIKDITSSLNLTAERAGQVQTAASTLNGVATTIQQTI